MKIFFLDLWHDLRAKRLWPVAVVLVVALIAVPVVLSKSSEQPAAAPEKAVRKAPDPKDLKALASVTLNEAAESRGSSLDTFDPSNPFRPPKAIEKRSQQGAEGASTITSGGGAGGDDGSTGDSGGDTGSTGGGDTGSTGGGDNGSTGGDTPTTDTIVFDLRGGPSSYTVGGETLTGYSKSHLSLLGPSMLELEEFDLEVTGDMPTYVQPEDAYGSILIEKLNPPRLFPEVDLGDRAFGGVEGHSEEMGFALTPEEYRLLIEMVDNGGQFYSRENSAGLTFE